MNREKVVTIQFKYQVAIHRLSVHRTSTIQNKASNLTKSIYLVCNKKQFYFLPNNETQVIIIHTKNKPRSNVLYEKVIHYNYKTTQQ